MSRDNLIWLINYVKRRLNAAPVESEEFKIRIKQLANLRDKLRAIDKNISIGNYGSL